MAKKISMFRIREDRADMLREKAVELTVKKKEIVKESELINFLIDEFVERIDIDQNGIFVDEEKEDEKKPQKIGGTPARHTGALCGSGDARRREA